MVQKSRRRIIREQVLQVLFAYEMNKDSLQYLKDEILTDVSSKTELEFATLYCYNFYHKFIVTVITFLWNVDKK